MLLGYAHHWPALPLQPHRSKRSAARLFIQNMETWTRPSLTICAILLIFIGVHCTICRPFSGGSGVDDDHSWLQLPPLTADSPPGAVPGVIVTHGNLRRTHTPAASTMVAPQGFAAPRMKANLQVLPGEGPQAPAELAALQEEARELDSEVTAARQEAALLQETLRAKEQERGGRNTMASFISVLSKQSFNILGPIYVNLTYGTASIAGMLVLMILGFQLSRLWAEDPSERLHERKDKTVASAEPPGGAKPGRINFCITCCRRCLCDHKLSSKILFHCIACAWLVGLGLLWHLGILQTFLEQLSVVLVFASLIFAVVLLSAAEMYIIVSGEIASAFKFFSHLSKQLDGVLRALGFREADGDAAGQVEKDPRSIGEAVASAEKSNAYFAGAARQGKQN
eukprot:SRR837773.8679.p1 GENE.SRR837773.8679~~SRR837773.8679.p1  ORF type:complete len:397 (+),score=39.71 SRR837773.8679:88-1278(+)